MSDNTFDQTTQQISNQSNQSNGPVKKSHRKNKSETLRQQANENREKKEKRKQQQRERQREQPPPKELIEPIFRPMIEVPSDRKVTLTNGNKKMTLMSYNILAQSLCNRDHFPNCGDSIKWKNRSPGLIREILFYSPDVACFQEMETMHLENTYRPEFEKAGYELLFFRGTGKKNHGCCIMWKRSRFTKLAETLLEFDQVGVSSMQTTCVGISVALGFRSDEEHDQDENADGRGGIIVATTHLYWRPGCLYERARQALIFCESLINLKKEVGFPVFLAGDLNTSPRDAAYSLLTKNGSLTEPDVMLQLTDTMMSFEEKDEDEPSSSSVSPSPPPSPSVPDLISRFSKIPRYQSLYAQHYSLIDPENTVSREPKHTCYGHWFQGTVDYILVMEEGLKAEQPPLVQVTKILKMPNEQDLLPAIPNMKFNSDHLCLMVEVDVYF